MKLYYSPGACSLASHIAMREAGIPVDLTKVDVRAKQYEGGDYRQVNGKGYVPALKLDDGQILNEGPSVLQYLADAAPESGLAPAWGTLERYQLIDMLNYLSTEVHKKLFYYIFNPTAAEATKAAAKEQLGPSLDYLTKRLGDRDTLVGSHFTVADAYFVTMLNWYAFVGVDLKKWPKIASYQAKHLARPAVAQAMAVEMAERKRRAA